MKKKIIFFLILFFYYFLNVYSNQPEINCYWLPWCSQVLLTEPISQTGNLGLNVIAKVIWETIQFVAVIAVIALIISGVMYLLSWWEEEKVKKAKTWIIWSLLWVIISISAWWIINILNKISI